MTLKQWEGLKPLAEENNINFVELGQLTEGKFSVDILWEGEILDGFDKYEIWCEPIGYHSFGASIDQDYIDEYFKRNPNK